MRCTLLHSDDLAAEASMGVRKRLFLPAPEPLRPLLGADAFLPHFGAEAIWSVGAPELAQQLSFQAPAFGNGTASTALQTAQAQASAAAPDAVLKVCSKCRLQKLLEDFKQDDRTSDGLACCCQVCASAAELERRLRRGLSPEPTSPNKTCPRCGDHKPMEESYRTTRGSDGISAHCKACTRGTQRINFDKTRHALAAFKAARAATCAAPCRSASKSGNREACGEGLPVGQDLQLSLCSHVAPDVGSGAAATLTRKGCARCGKAKMPEGFNLIRHNRDGFANLCRVCARAAQAEARGCMSPVLEPTVERKLCRNCGVNKAAEDFHRDKTRRVGLSLYCRLCCSKRGHHYYCIRRQATAWFKELALEQGIQYPQLTVPGPEFNTAAAFSAAEKDDTDCETAAAVSASTKVCTGCGAEKALEEFKPGERALDGPRQPCRVCFNAAEQERRRRRGAVIQATVKRKFCNKCGTNKAAEEFAGNKAGADGLDYCCKACMQRRYQVSKHRATEGLEAAQGVSLQQPLQQHGSAPRQPTEDQEPVLGLPVSSVARASVKGPATPTDRDRPRSRRALSQDDRRFRVSADGAGAPQAAMWGQAVASSPDTRLNAVSTAAGGGARRATTISGGAAEAHGLFASAAVSGRKSGSAAAPAPTPSGSTTSSGTESTPQCLGPVWDTMVPQEDSSPPRTSACDSTAAQHAALFHLDREGPAGTAVVSTDTDALEAAHPTLSAPEAGLASPSWQQAQRFAAVEADSGQVQPQRAAAMREDGSQWPAAPQQQAYVAASATAESSEQVATPPNGAAVPSQSAPAGGQPDTLPAPRRLSVHPCEATGLLATCARLLTRTDVAERKADPLLAVDPLSGVTRATLLANIRLANAASATISCTPKRKATRLADVGAGASTSSGHQQSATASPAARIHPPAAFNLGANSAPTAANLPSGGSAQLKVEQSIKPALEAARPQGSGSAAQQQRATVMQAVADAAAHSGPEAADLPAEGTPANIQRAATSPVAAQQQEQDTVRRPEVITGAADGGAGRRQGTAQMAVDVQQRSRSAADGGCTTQSDASRVPAAAGQPREAQAKPAGSPVVVRTVRRQGVGADQDAAEPSHAEGSASAQQPSLSLTPALGPAERTTAQLQPSWGDGAEEAWRTTPQTCSLPRLPVSIGCGEGAAATADTPLAASPPRPPGFAESGTRDRINLYLPDPALLRPSRSPRSPRAAAAAAAFAPKAVLPPVASSLPAVPQQQAPEPAGSPAEAAPAAKPVQQAPGASDPRPDVVSPTLASLATLQRQIGFGSSRQLSITNDTSPSAAVRTGPQTGCLRFQVPVVYGMDIEIPPALAQAALPGVAALVGKAGRSQPATVPVLLVREPGRPSQHYWWANLRSDPRGASATAERRWCIPAADWRFHVVQTVSDFGAFPDGCGQLIITVCPTKSTLWGVTLVPVTGSAASPVSQQSGPSDAAATASLQPTLRRADACDDDGSPAVPRSDHAAQPDMAEVPVACRIIRPASDATPLAAGPVASSHVAQRTPLAPPAGERIVVAGSKAQVSTAAQSAGGTAGSDKAADAVSSDYVELSSDDEAPPPAAVAAAHASQQSLRPAVMASLAAAVSALRPADGSSPLPSTEPTAASASAPPTAAMQPAAAKSAAALADGPQLQRPTGKISAGQGYNAGGPQPCAPVPHGPHTLVWTGGDLDIPPALATAAVSSLRLPRAEQQWVRLMVQVRLERCSAMCTAFMYPRPQAGALSTSPHVRYNIPAERIQKLLVAVGHADCLPPMELLIAPSSKNGTLWRMDVVGAMKLVALRPPTLHPGSAAAHGGAAAVRRPPAVQSSSVGVSGRAVQQVMAGVEAAEQVAVSPPAIGVRLSTDSGKHNGVLPSHSERAQPTAATSSLQPNPGLVDSSADTRAPVVPPSERAAQPALVELPAASRAAGPAPGATLRDMGPAEALHADGQVTDPSPARGRAIPASLPAQLFAAGQPLGGTAGGSTAPEGASPEVIDVTSDDEQTLPAARAAAAVPPGQWMLRHTVSPPAAAAAWEPRPAVASAPPSACGATLATSAVPLPAAAAVPTAAVSAAASIAASWRQPPAAALMAGQGSNAARRGACAEVAPGVHLLSWFGGDLDVPPALAAAAVSSSDLTTEQRWVRVTLEVRTDSCGATGTAFLFVKPQPTAPAGRPEVRYFIPSGQLVELLSIACYVDCTAPVDLLIKPSRVDCTIWRMDVIRAAKRVAQQPSSLQPYSAATGRTAAAAWRLPASQPFDVGVHATAAVQQPTPQLGSGAENGSPAQQLMAESELVPQADVESAAVRVQLVAYPGQDLDIPPSLGERVLPASGALSERWVSFSVTHPLSSHCIPLALARSYFLLHSQLQPAAAPGSAERRRYFLSAEGLWWPADYGAAPEPIILSITALSSNATAWEVEKECPVRRGPAQPSVVLLAQAGQSLTVPKVLAEASAATAASWSPLTLVVRRRQEAGHVEQEVGLCRSSVLRQHPRGRQEVFSIPALYVDRLLQLSDRQDASGRLQILVTPSAPRQWTVDLLGPPQQAAHVPDMQQPAGSHNLAGVTESLQLHDLLHRQRQLAQPLEARVTRPLLHQQHHQQQQQTAALQPTDNCAQSQQSPAQSMTAVPADRPPEQSIQQTVAAVSGLKPPEAQVEPAPQSPSWWRRVISPLWMQKSVSPDTAAKEWSAVKARKAVPVGSPRWKSSPTTLDNTCRVNTRAAATEVSGAVRSPSPAGTCAGADAEAAPLEAVDIRPEFASKAAAEVSSATASQSPAPPCEGDLAEARDDREPRDLAALGEGARPDADGPQEPSSPTTASKEAQNNQVGGESLAALVRMRRDTTASSPQASLRPEPDGLPRTGVRSALPSSAGPPPAQDAQRADVEAEMAAGKANSLRTAPVATVSRVAGPEADVQQEETKHAEVKPTLTEAEAGAASAGAAPAPGSVALQPCAAHEERCTADCITCPDCRMRCKRCRMAKPLSEFQLITKVVTTGEPPQECLKATCKVCRRARKSEGKADATARISAAADPQLTAVQTSPATGMQQAAAVRDAALASPPQHRQQTLPSTPHVAESLPEDSLANAAAAELQEQRLQPVAGQATLRGTPGAAAGRQGQQQQQGQQGGSGAAEKDGQDGAGDEDPGQPNGGQRPPTNPQWAAGVPDPRRVQMGAALAVESPTSVDIKLDRPDWHQDLVVPPEARHLFPNLDLHPTMQRSAQQVFVLVDPTGQEHICLFKARITYDPNIAELQKLVTRIGGGWPSVCSALGLRQHSTARFTSTDTIGRLSVSMVDDGGGADDVDMMPLGRRLERLASNRSHAVSEVASAAAGPAEPAHNAQRISRAGTPTGAVSALSRQTTPIREGRGVVQQATADVNSRAPRSVVVADPYDSACPEGDESSPPARAATAATAFAGVKQHLQYLVDPGPQSAPAPGLGRRQAFEAEASPASQLRLQIDHLVGAKAHAGRVEDSCEDLPPHLAGRAVGGPVAAIKGQSPSLRSPSLGSVELPPGFGPPRPAANATPAVAGKAPGRDLIRKGSSLGHPTKPVPRADATTWPQPAAGGTFNGARSPAAAGGIEAQEGAARSPAGRGTQGRSQLPSLPWPQPSGGGFSVGGGSAASPPAGIRSSAQTGSAGVPPWPHTAGSGASAPGIGGRKPLPQPVSLGFSAEGAAKFRQEFTANGLARSVALPHDAPKPGAKATAHTLELHLHDGEKYSVNCLSHFNGCTFRGSGWGEVAARLEELAGPASTSMQVTLAREPYLDSLSGMEISRLVISMEQVRRLASQGIAPIPERVNPPSSPRSGQHSKGRDAGAASKRAFSMGSAGGSSAQGGGRRATAGGAGEVPSASGSQRPSASAAARQPPAQRDEPASGEAAPARAAGTAAIAAGHAGGVQDGMPSERAAPGGQRAARPMLRQASATIPAKTSLRSSDTGAVRGVQPDACPNNGPVSAGYMSSALAPSAGSDEAASPQEPHEDGAASAAPPSPAVIILSSSSSDEGDSSGGITVDIEAISNDNGVSSGQCRPATRKRDRPEDEAAFTSAAAEAAAAAARGDGRRKARAPKRAQVDAELAAEPMAMYAAAFEPPADTKLGPGFAAGGINLGAVPRAVRKPGWQTYTVRGDVEADNIGAVPSERVQHPCAAAPLPSPAKPASLMASATATMASPAPVDALLGRQPPDTIEQQRIADAEVRQRLTPTEPSPQPQPAASGAARGPQPASSSSKLTPGSDRELPVLSVYDRPPRAAAPLPGQLREDGPLKPPAAAKEQPVERAAAAAKKRKAPEQAAAPAAAARAVGALAKKKSKKPSAASAATAAPQVCEGEKEQIGRAAEYRAAAGEIDPAKVAEGEARLGALLPPNWQDPAVSVCPEDNVYIERPRDGSQLTWQYRENNAALSIAHCRPKVSVAVLAPITANFHDHDNEFAKGGFRQALRHTQFKLWAGHDPRPGLGYRVIAREVIPAGSFVFEYAGDYLPKEESQARFNEVNIDGAAEQLQRHRYVFTITKGWAVEWVPEKGRWVDTLDTIDAEKAGNVSRLMNHSCEPSLQQLHIMQLRGYPRIPFVAARHIYPGDELTIDYMPDYEKKKHSYGKESLKPCLCSSQRCRGWTC